MSLLSFILKEKQPILKGMSEHIDDAERYSLNDKVLVDAGWVETAMKHYCGPCERWFADVRGKLSHDRSHKRNQ